jgi:hypothetical protein
VAVDGVSFQAQACSYLPGKSKVHMVFRVGVIPLAMIVHKAVEPMRLPFAAARKFSLKNSRPAN